VRRSSPSGRSGAHGRWPVRRFVWVALGVAVVVALAFGSYRPGRQTAAQRASAIEADLRCPSCEDISVADSSAATAVAIRQVVTTRVGEGESTAQIEGFLESRYGVGILLRPPTSGLSVAVWIVPLVAVALAAVGLGAFFWRRRGGELAPVAAEDRDLVEEAMRRARDEAGP